MYIPAVVKLTLWVAYKVNFWGYSLHVNVTFCVHTVTVKCFRTIIRGRKEESTIGSTTDEESDQSCFASGSFYSRY